MIPVLVLCDDVWHPSEVIERGLRELKETSFKFDFVKDSKDILSVEMLREYPIIINCKADNLNSSNEAPWFEAGVTEVGVKELKEYVNQGGGFLSVHSGNTYNQERGKEYADFVGNNFVTHPPRCQIQIKVLQKHPVTEGVEDFVIRDEHYQLEGIASDAQILLESVSETGGTQAAGYVRTIGKGRMCVLTPGHILDVWKNPNFQKLLINALHWCWNQ